MRRLAIALLLSVLLSSGHGQQQRFHVRPQDAEVVEGDSHTLSCSVEHQAGRVQWVKNGFALGYERSLPGFPRYQLLGDPAAGVHDLQVNNVTLEDNGEFQCQASPGSGQQPIRASATITVLLRPLAVTVTSEARQPRPGQLEVREGAELALTCDVIGAKPAATVRWQRQGAAISPDQELTSSDPELEGRGNTTATATLRPTRDDDGVGFSCVARHPAVRAADQHRFNTTFILSVLYPPGAPEISGYEEGEVVRMGEEKTLTCTSRRGNPLAELVWFKNDEPITYQYRTIRNRAVSKYTFEADASDLHAIYRCEASSIVHPQSMVAIVQMDVQFGPDSVEITGTEEAKHGETVDLTCTTSSSNPASNITWVINGRTIANVSSGPGVYGVVSSHSTLLVSAAQTTQEVTDDPAGGWVSASNVSTTVPAGLREDLTVSCYALNPSLGITEVGTLKVTVLYPPKRPRIVGYTPGTHLKSGQRVSLSCLAQGGSPPASLTWYKGDDEREAESDTEDDVTRSVLAFTVDFRDNEKMFKCESTNPALEEPHTTNVTLLVYYPPSKLKLKSRPKKLKADSRAVLTCESKPSNPAANLTWWRDSELITKGVSRLTSEASGDHGGVISKRRLRRKLVWSDDQAVYTCRATVPFLPGNMHDALTLDVAYAPVFAVQSATEDVLVGGASQLNYSARANPDNITYAWLSSSGPVPEDSGRVVGLGPLLNISDVQKSDAGWYRLQASNEQGTSTLRVYLNVQYPPEVTRLSRELLVPPGAAAVLECTADANPTTEHMISWARDDFDLEDSNKTKTFYSNGSGFLTVYRASREDIGLFLCMIDNGIGALNVTAGLLVEHEPEIDTSPQFAKAAAEKGDTGHVTCRASGAPNVTFEWSRQGALIDESTDPDKYQLEYTREDLVTWQSVLKVVSVVTSDYGPYVCVARNELNFQRREIVLGGTTSPDPPLSLTVQSVTGHSVTLSWTPGFDGGLIQRYRVRYTETSGSQRYSYEDVEPENATLFTVELLRPQTEYSFAVMAFNERGDSAYTKDVVKAKTGAGPADPFVPEEDSTTAVLSRVAIVIMTLAGAILLALNVVLISCYVRRRRRRLLTASLTQGSSGSSWRREPGSGSGSAPTYADSLSETTDSASELSDTVSGGRTAYPGEGQWQAESRYGGYPARPASPVSSAYGRAYSERSRQGLYRRGVSSPGLLPGDAGGRADYYPYWDNSGASRDRLVTSPVPSIRSDVNIEHLGDLF